MRESAPVFLDPRRRNWSVFKYNDVQRVLSEHSTFSSQFIGSNQPLDASMISMDPPRHRQLRSLVTLAFTPRTIARLEPRITDIVNELLDRLAQLPRGINIVILDACRTNPFAGSDVVLPDGRRLKFRGATPTGLARMDVPLGTLLAFSTAPGGVALDDPTAKHSIYAKYLLDNLATPGMPVEQMFKRVRAGVAGETGRMQVPWESSSLTGDFCFKPGGGACVIAAGPAR